VRQATVTTESAQGRQAARHTATTCTAGYGFMASVDNMVSHQKAGKAFVSINDGETLCCPSLVSGAQGKVTRWRAHPLPWCQPPPMWPVRPPVAAS
jgi:hypothetical protein